MRRLALASVWAAVLGAVLPLPRAAQAGASLRVDNAGTVPDGHCQLESWLRLRGRDSEATAVPACGLGGMEYSLGGSAYAGTPSGPWLVAGLKRTLRDMDAAAPGFAVSLGAAWRRPGLRLAAGTADVAASMALGPSWTVHADLGWNAARGERPRPGGGVGVEYALGPRWIGLGELYAERGAGRTVQAGLRRLFGRGVSCDLLAGHDRDGRWLTLGFNYSPGDS
ncbi:hypothetical protein ASG87_10850 [Frateuria sp. Soil773]|uniref:hypothetical protein n=1 Tax=Frateuria sp. Soil773 TaxID=1736407 RepID=UPI0006F93C30|nr:hypothetical protein [Frateuria sp. Soil773]KRF01988.1 hypothetical protein ASG87_10850 [Frateuria sp. Soil773]